MRKHYIINREVVRKCEISKTHANDAVNIYSTLLQLQITHAKGTDIIKQAMRDIKFI